jgi:hypothetical protein
LRARTLISFGLFKKLFTGDALTSHCRWEHRAYSSAGGLRVMKSRVTVRGSGEDSSRCLSEPPAHACRANSLLPALVFLGVLAFVFSAVSPADDDIQQALFHKKPHCSRLAPGSSCVTRLPRNHGMQPAVLLASHSVPNRDLASTIWVGELHAHVELIASTNGERSPPIC